MCLYGTLKMVSLNRPRKSGRQEVPVDACIAEEIQELNNRGIHTLGCCCGHGEAGKNVEWENESSKWRGKSSPPEVLIDVDSVRDARKLGYQPYPYYYADDEHNDVWQMQLKTGCITLSDCEIWHSENNVPFKKHIGLI